VVRVELVPPPPPPPLSRDDDADAAQVTSARTLEPFEIQNAINSRLPMDISVVDAQAVPTNQEGEPLFDPRHHVVQKQYSYALKFRRKVRDAGDGELLPICRVGPNSFRHAFDSPCCWVVPWPLDDSSMRPLCQLLEGRHNFAAFVHKESRREPTLPGGSSDGPRHEIALNTMRYDVLSESEEDAPVVTARLVFESKGFRRTMVRNLVGFCVDVCRGMPDVSGDTFDWSDVWSESAASKIHAAPACGLCLEWVRY
jgi:tRNA pseudouridine(38-40) synthase